MGRMKAFRCTLLLLLLLVGPALAAEAPQWESDVPLDLNGLRLLMPEAEVATLLGPADREVEPDLRVFGGSALVRTREGKVVNVSVFDGGGEWKLHQGGRELSRTGLEEVEILRSFGEPSGRFRNLQKPLHALLFTSRWADLGVMIHGGRVLGFMLAEPGQLARSLQDAGYETVEP